MRFLTSSLPLRFINPGCKTFIVLIPKTENPRNVKDFHPISLCNVSYKIISKILASRLKQVIHNLIPQEQSRFIPGRATFDYILAVQEISHSLESDFGSPPPAHDKIDIEKAFDTIEWPGILAT